MRREFKTTWSKEHVELLNRYPPQYFDVTREDTKAIIPDDIPFLDLLGFIGKQTKVTIEVIG